jgi:hypothetical protein
MDADEFVKLAWAHRDEAARKDFVRAHAPSLPLAELERAVTRTLEEAGWNIGILMVALRILQILPSEAILHFLMAMDSEGATFAPGGARLRAQLRGHLKALTAKHPALAEAAKRYRRPDWAKRPGEREAASTEAQAPKKATTKKATAKKAIAKNATAKKATAKSAAPGEPSAKETAKAKRPANKAAAPTKTAAKKPTAAKH